MQKLNLDGTKIAWYADRVKAWGRGERVAPITIDMALTQACNFNCVYCYGKLQSNQGSVISRKHISTFLQDAADIGVKGVSFVSDGESTISPECYFAIRRGHSLGLSMALGTNAYLCNGSFLAGVLPCLTYLRVNISAGEEGRYREIMGTGSGVFETVVDNIRQAVQIKRNHKYPCTIGMQMVFMPEFADQVIPLAKLALALGVDYLIIKHCSDDEHGTLGVPYAEYKDFYELFRRAEGMSTPQTSIQAKWSKIQDGDIRSYKRCLAPPFILQISGSGLVAPCGMLFGDSYSKYHIGNITKQGFKEMWLGERYWRVMDKLKSKAFNAKTMCGSLCLQHNTNKRLYACKEKGVSIERPSGEEPEHIAFI